MLEDEKILGTVHVAFGASAGIGGTVSVPIHLDVVVIDASLEIGGRQVLDAGRFVLDGDSRREHTLLAIPNVSEGRDADAIERIAASVRRRRAARRALRPRPPPQRVHDRGRARSTLAAAVVNGARRARSTRSTSPDHDGIHPRVGAIDVAPIVFLDDADRGAACAEALVLADMLGDELELPVFLYGILAGGRTRAELRRGGPRRADTAGSRPASSTPDFGPSDCTPPPARCSSRPARR